jgi:hypothetical protein
LRPKVDAYKGFDHDITKDVLRNGLNEVGFMTTIKLGKSVGDKGANF